MNAATEDTASRAPSTAPGAEERPQADGRETRCTGSRRPDGASASSSGEGSAAPTDREEERLNRASALLFGVRKSVRYHARRQAWFEGLHNWSLAVSLALTGGAAVVFFEKSDILAYTSFAAGIVLALNLVGGFSRRAANHHQLATWFSVLESKLVPLRPLEASEYQPLMRERLELEAAEPPPLMLLNALCHYELIRATREDRREHAKQQVASIPWRRLALRNVRSQAEYVTSKLE